MRGPRGRGPGGLRGRGGTGGIFSAAHATHPVAQYVGSGWVGLRTPTHTHWLVLGRAGSDLPIVESADGRGVLPVFGFEEEAGLFARLSRRGGQSIRRIETDDLVSLLCGPLEGVDLVALDPLSDAEADVMEGSVSLTRQRFLDFLLGPGSPDGLDQNPGQTDRRGPSGSTRRGPGRRSP
ncbi:MAG TPA: hypothetical protein VGR18_08935 [Rubrobacter sp.]|nr:hypothetical protein [Rubrobacter sp.]